MARHCVKWASGRKRKHSRRRGHGARHCRYGKVKRGRRKGQCLKTRRARKSGVLSAKAWSRWAASMR
jgi:hypothetical protein